MSLLDWFVLERPGYQPKGPEVKNPKPPKGGTGEVICRPKPTPPPTKNLQQLQADTVSFSRK